MAPQLRLKLLHWLKKISFPLVRFCDYRIQEFEWTFQNAKKKLYCEKKKLKKEVKEIIKKNKSIQNSFKKIEKKLLKITKKMKKHDFFAKQEAFFDPNPKKLKKEETFFENEVIFFQKEIIQKKTLTQKECFEKKNEEFKEKEWQTSVYFPETVSNFNCLVDDTLRIKRQIEEETNRIFLKEINWKYTQKLTFEDWEELELLANNTQKTNLNLLSQRDIEKKEWNFFYNLHLTQLKKIELAKNFSMEKELAKKWITKEQKINNHSFNNALSWIDERFEREKMYQSLDSCLNFIDFYDFFTLETFSMFCDSIYITQLFDRSKTTSEMFLLGILTSEELKPILQPIINEKKVLNVILNSQICIVNNKVESEEFDIFEAILKKIKVKEKVYDLIKTLKKENFVLSISSFSSNISSIIQNTELSLGDKIKNSFKFIDLKLNEFDDTTLKFFEEIELFLKEVTPIFLKENIGFKEFEINKMDLAPEMIELFKTVIRLTDNLKNPIITTEMILLAMMETKNSNAYKILKKLIPKKLNWYLLRFRLLKRVRLGQISICNLKNQRFFGMLLQKEISDYRFHRLLEIGALDIAVELFRYELVEDLYNSHKRRKLLNLPSELMESIKLKSFKKLKDVNYNVFTEKEKKSPKSDQIIKSSISVELETKLKKRVQKKEIQIQQIPKTKINTRFEESIKF